MQNYIIQLVYEKLRGDKQIVHWDRVVWNRHNVPKHRFVLWMDVQEKMRTIERLASIGISDTNLFLICANETEPHRHFFPL